MTFMPVFYVQKGFTVVSAGVLFSLFTIAGTVSGLTAGHLADRIGFRKIFLVTHGLMGPVLLLLLYLEGGWVYFGVVLAGIFVLATMPLGVALAQQLAPKGRSMVASLMMGFAFGLGGVVSPLVGKMADIYSIHTTLAAMSLLPLLSLPLILAFPETGEKLTNYPIGLAGAMSVSWSGPTPDRGPWRNRGRCCAKNLLPNGRGYTPLSVARRHCRPGFFYTRRISATVR